MGSKCTRARVQREPRHACRRSEAPLPKHVLVFIHGITPARDPGDVRKQYDALEKRVKAAGLPLSGDICKVSWGVPDPTGPARPDQDLTRAEQFVGGLVSEAALAAAPRSEAPVELGTDWSIPGVRPLLRSLRESVVLYGLADAIYYASAEGEAEVRAAVFGQVFKKLEASADGDVRLHIVAHSLGVAVAHDFLYALFGSKSPHFPSESKAGEVTLPPDIVALQRVWRCEALKDRLKLGSFISFASQLPLFAMRTQQLVTQLAGGTRLDPALIGIDKARSEPQWLIFYDSDDPLGFATRRLYEPSAAILDVHANSGLGPVAAHVDYWEKPDILDRCIAHLRANMRET